MNNVDDVGRVVDVSSTSIDLRAGEVCARLTASTWKQQRSIVQFYTLQCVYAGAWLSSGRSAKLRWFGWLCRQRRYDLRNLPMCMRSISVNQSDMALSTGGQSLPCTQIRDPHC